MELTCPNWDPSIFDFSHEDAKFESNVHPEEYNINYIEPYMSEGYDLESPRTSSPDPDIHVARSKFEHLVLPLIRRYGNQAIEESSLVLYHFEFEEGIPGSRHGFYTASRMGNSYKAFDTWKLPIGTQCLRDTT